MHIFSQTYRTVNTPRLQYRNNRCSEVQNILKNTLCGQDVEFDHIKPGGT